MIRLLLACLCSSTFFLLAATGVSGQPKSEEAEARNPKWEDASWVWAETEGNPLEGLAASTVWFRSVVRGNEPSTGAIRIACDDHFVLWVNGKRIGEGRADKAYRFNLNGVVERGPNVIAVEATNLDGKAGLFVDGEIRGQSGKQVSFDTPENWKFTASRPAGNDWLTSQFDDGTWKPVRRLAAHAESPWKDLAFSGSYLDRFEVAPGFELKRVAAPAQVGSIICITWGNRGRLLASQEKGPILNLIDEDLDGVYEKVTEFCTEVKSCQGLCMVGDDLIAVGNGPQKAGIYRLSDKNHDDQADSVELISQPKGNLGEHGPHDVVLGPDGWLYHNLGNHAWITAIPEATSACRNMIEGNLLDPAFEDANGHAVGIKAPGGTIWRFSPDGKRWWLETSGFRNHYDIAFNSQGDLFTFDSDMEWDVNLPWYRPVRINHCIPGAEFGWRSGAKNWPDYYVDSLPGTVNIGRGSPTGLVFYEHTQFPEKYRGALLNCDWSMGRLIVSYLTKDGATYTGTWENLVTGNPLNISDIEVDRDGTVVFSTGGRGTEGGIYRLTWSGSKPVTVPAPKTIDDLLTLPQGQSAWARDLVRQFQVQRGDGYEAELLTKLKTGTAVQKIRGLSILAQSGPKPSHAVLLQCVKDSDASVRAFAAWLLADYPTAETDAALKSLLADSDAMVQRRACEAYVRAGLEAPVDPLLALLGHEDRWLRFAARLALERVPAEKWKKAGLAKSGQPDVVFNTILAAIRTNSLDDNPPAIEDAIKKSGFTESQVTAEVRIRQGRDMLRLAEHLLLSSPDAWTTQLKSGLAGEMLRLLQAKATGKSENMGLATTLMGDQGFCNEAAVLVGFLQPQGTVEVLVELLEKSKDPAAQIHYAMCLSYVETGWTAELNRRVMSWYETTRKLEGGHSLHGYIANVVGAILRKMSPSDRASLLVNWKQFPFAAQLLLTTSDPEQIQDFDLALEKVLMDLEDENNATLQDMIGATIDSLAKSAQPAAQATLRKLYDQQPDRREQLARALAARPSAENAAYYFRALASGEGATLQQCLQALNRSGAMAQKASEYQAVILAGLKLKQGGGRLAVQLLKKWTGVAPKRGDDIEESLAVYQQWYTEKFPEAPAAELPQDDIDKTKYSLTQILDLLERGPKGDIERGKVVFTKATCIRCHRFGKEGEGVGPDLTTVRRRFQKKDVIESVLYPSQVISDQYRAVTISTADGLIYSGMPLPNTGNEKQLTLLLSDATKVVVAKDKIEDQLPAKMSVMPEGLFKNLTEQEVIDLFTYLETSKSNAEHAPK